MAQDLLICLYQKDITNTVEDLMATQTAQVTVPPEEEADLTLYKYVYKDLEPGVYRRRHRRGP